MGGNLLKQILVLVGVLVLINVVASLAGWEFRVSIIGSVILTVVISLALTLFRRGSR